MRLEALRILIAEDDPNDVELFRLAIGRVNARPSIAFVADGQEAIEYLQGHGKYTDRAMFPFPNILITDLKMPRHSGFDLLKWLNTHEECGVIPTIVLTSSGVPTDITLSYQLKANTYFKKPSDFVDLVALMKLIFEYWFKADVPEPPMQHKCK